MIKIKELRIGNWVKFFCDPNTIGCECNQPNINFEHQIKMLNNDGDVDIGHITGFGITNEEIHGIEITENILESFGFNIIKKSKYLSNLEEYKYNYKFYEKYIKYECNLYSIRNVSSDTECYFEFEVIDILENKGIKFKIKYVHQLQNIMFFNTGIELKKI